MNLKFSPLSLNGRRLRYYRQIFALGLVLIVFLPNLVLSVSANVPIDSVVIDSTSGFDHFLLYVDEKGDTVCREATESEARELDKIKPIGLRNINHLDMIKPGLKAEALPQHLTIILRATPSLEANAPAKAAFIRAAQAWENLITTPVTIYIDADLGPTNFGEDWDTGVLGATSSPSFTADYTKVRSTLNGVANTPGQQAVYNALPQSSVPIDAGSGSATAVSVSNSIARAVGLAYPTAQSTDAAPRIGFNSAVNFDFDSSNGVVGRDFQSVATHEIGHALGFTSRSGTGNSIPAMWDLYRFRSGTTAGTFTTAPRIMTLGGPALNSQYYFVPGISEIGLSDGGPNPPSQPPFPNNSDGNQSSHWRQALLNFGGIYIGIMDPRLPQNITRPITTADTDALHVFGYNSNFFFPDPPANDNFANAQVINGCSGSVNGTNVSATPEIGEPNHLSTTTDKEGGGSRSIWYRWQAPSSGNVTFDTSGSGFDTVMGVYVGNDLNSLGGNIIAQDDDVVNGTIRTSSITFNASAGTTYMIAVDGYNSGGAGGEMGSVTLNWNAPSCVASNVQFSQSTYLVNESAGFVQITITRTGSVAGPATVNYATADSAGLVSCAAVTGIASERCDYATTTGTARFAAGENSSSVFIPIVNDALVEGGENFGISLSSPSGATLGSPATATISITDNDVTPATQNPMDGFNFFVTQQYIDFLGRLPDETGFHNWVDTLSVCPNGGFGEFDNPQCDRVHVSAGFFLSQEFQGRGYFAYRFYEVALDRRPTYAEFVPDMALVGGSQSPESEALSKQTYTDAWMQRPEFKSRYDALTNSQYVNALETNAEVTVTNKATLIAALDNAQMNRGQVLRNIVESQAVADRFFNRAFVSMQYFGYLRRDPDTVGFQNWLNTLNADPSNFRHMIFGFLFSTEYLQRFGP